jgi:hypothetical protein
MFATVGTPFALPLKWSFILEFAEENNHGVGEKD